MFGKGMFLFLLALGLAFGTATAFAQEIPAAYRFTQQDAEAASTEALVQKGAGKRVQANISGLPSKILWEGAHPISSKLTGLVYDKTSNRWSASLLLMSEEKIVRSLPVGGRYEEMVMLPVLKRQLRNGETIRVEDIDMLEYPLSRTRNDVIMDASKIVGLSPRSSISPRRPVRETEVSTPALVKRGSVVTLQYAASGMSISTTGQAMENGAKGDMIEVKNLTSKTVVRAMVENANTLVIRSPAAQQLAGDVHAQ